MRLLISDDLNQAFLETDITRVPTMTLISFQVEKDPAILDSGFYRFNATYAGCGVALEGTIQPQPEGSWLIDTVSGNPNSTPQTRGNGCG
jgi:hypothetical protein